jgi:hypothetical protein
VKYPHLGALGGQLHIILIPAGTGHMHRYTWYSVRCCGANDKLFEALQENN